MDAPNDEAARAARVLIDHDARRQIHDAVLHYCRGIDRLHAPSVARAFHPGAVLNDYGPSPMTIEAFVEHALSSLGNRFVATQHRASNTLIAFDGDGPASGAASVETYVLAFHVEAAADSATPGLMEGAQLHTFAGRYIDRFTEVDGAWRISERTLRNDWTMVEPIERRMRGSYVAGGRGDGSDLVFATLTG